MRVALGLVIACAVAGVACGNESTAKGSKPAAAAAAADGEICKEHGVLESICTKCNPKLIPVFQAKGDWCPEHGFPESVCPICHPELGGRPAADVGTDGAPADGTKVRLKATDTARIAGIETVAAEGRPGGARLEVLATITYDPTRHAQINPRAAGVVRALHVDVGDKVAKGARIISIESASVGADRSRLQAADARVRVATANHEREIEMQAKGVSTIKELQAAEQELAAAKAERAAAASALGMVGGGTSGSSYVLTSPLAGTVTQRGATIGRMVEGDDVLFEIVDTSRMRADLEIPETDLGVARSGQDVTVRIDGLGDAEFHGAIDYIAPEVDRETRTAQARVMLANPDGSLRANMFGRGLIALGEARATVMVPRAAIQRVGAVELCFVKLGEAEYETRRVKTGLVDGDRIEIVGGIKPGEAVVTTGSFLLKTETLKGSIGAGCCD